MVWSSDCAAPDRSAVLEGAQQDGEGARHIRGMEVCGYINGRAQDVGPLCAEACHLGTRGQGGRAQGVGPTHAKVCHLGMGGTKVGGEPGA